jgi:hypothetical protein
MTPVAREQEVYDSRETAGRVAGKLVCASLCSPFSGRLQRKTVQALFLRVLAENRDDRQQTGAKKF